LPNIFSSGQHPDLCFFYVSFVPQVAPIRSSVHNVSHAIKNVPEGITGGLHRVSGGLHRVLRVRKYFLHLNVNVNLNILYKPDVVIHA
jgi:hypothetical protein